LSGSWEEPPEKDLGGVFNALKKALCEEEEAEEEGEAEEEKEEADADGDTGPDIERGLEEPEEEEPEEAVFIPPKKFGCTPLKKETILLKKGVNPLAGFFPRSSSSSFL
jgi:hypothetical protein